MSHPDARPTETARSSNPHRIPAYAGCTQRREDAASHRDIKAALVLAIEAVLVPRLDAMAKILRTLVAANDGHFSDPSQLYRLPTILKLLGISKSTWYAWSNPKSASHDPTVPKAIKLGNGAHSPSVWRAREVDAWIEARARTSHTCLK